MELTKQREARGWSKAELARRAGMGAADVSRIEARRLIPYPVQLEKLARALGIPAPDARNLVEAEDPSGS
jgi:ribosome-binding protein aMBF1 (putative translation factor)